MHAQNCIACRAKLQEGEILWGIKNADTREYRHVVASTSGEAQEKIGWNGSTLYTLWVRSWSPPMAEEIKTRLKKIREERRELRKPARADRAKKIWRP